jgi:hypothetical protein
VSLRLGALVQAYTAALARVAQLEAELAAALGAAGRARLGLPADLEARLRVGQPTDGATAAPAGVAGSFLARAKTLGPGGFASFHHTTGSGVIGGRGDSGGSSVGQWRGAAAAGGSEDGARKGPPPPPSRVA